MAAGLLAARFRITASWMIGAWYWAGTTHIEPLFSLPPSSTCASATKPSSALPVAMKLNVWPMLSPVTNLGCSVAAKPSFSIASTAAAP